MGRLQLPDSDKSFKEFWPFHADFPDEEEVKLEDEESSDSPERAAAGNDAEAAEAAKEEIAASEETDGNDQSDAAEKSGGSGVASPGKILAEYSDEIPRAIFQQRVPFYVEETNPVGLILQIADAYENAGQFLQARALYRLLPPFFKNSTKANRELISRIAYLERMGKPESQEGSKAAAN